MQRELNLLLFNWSCLNVNFYEATQIMDSNFSVLESGNQCFLVGLFVKLSGVDPQDRQMLFCRPNVILLYKTYLLIGLKKSDCLNFLNC